MDLLASLNINTLPEQQTFITSSIHDILETAQSKENVSDLRIGFNVCCSCGSPRVNLPCAVCNRVRYCSKQCRKEDAHRADTSGIAPENVEKGYPEGGVATGHSSVVCSLLRTCQIDNDVEKRGNSSLMQKYSKDQIDASKDRIQSEFESYPATLANVIAENSFLNTFLSAKYRRIKQVSGLRRGKQRKTKNHGDTVLVGSRTDEYDTSITHAITLSIHIIGASEGAELWGDLNDDCDAKNVYDAYTEAFIEIVDMYQLREVRLVFVGQDCPSLNQYVEKIITPSNNYDGSYNYRNIEVPNKVTSERKCINRFDACRLIIETLKSDYEHVSVRTMSTSEGSQNKKKLSRNGQSQTITEKPDDRPTELLPPDIVFFFNPGFTCPDYRWEAALHSIANGTPFIFATNTEMEALADCQYLSDMGFVQLDLGSVTGHDKFNPSSEAPCDTNIQFFGENPYAGLRVRQNSTMANDLYVKNRWIVVGMFGGENLSIATGSSLQSLPSCDHLIEDHFIICFRYRCDCYQVT